MGAEASKGWKVVAENSRSGRHTGPVGQAVDAEQELLGQIPWPRRAGCSPASMTGRPRSSLAVRTAVADGRAARGAEAADAVERARRASESGRSGPSTMSNRSRSGSALTGPGLYAVAAQKVSPAHDTGRRDEEAAVREAWLDVQVDPFHEYAMVTSRCLGEAGSGGHAEDGVVHEVLTSSPTYRPPEGRASGRTTSSRSTAAATGAQAAARPDGLAEGRARAGHTEKSLACPRLVVATVQADPFHCSIEDAHTVACPRRRRTTWSHRRRRPASSMSRRPPSASVMGDHVVPFQSSA